MLSLCVGPLGVVMVIRSLLRAGFQPTLDPCAETLCWSSALAQGKQGNW